MKAGVIAEGRDNLRVSPGPERRNAGGLAVAFPTEPLSPSPDTRQASVGSSRVRRGAAAGAGGGNDSGPMWTDPELCERQGKRETCGGTCSVVRERCCFKLSGYWNGKERRETLVVKEGGWRDTLHYGRPGLMRPSAQSGAALRSRRHAQ